MYQLLSYNVKGESSFFHYTLKKNSPTYFIIITVVVIVIITVIISSLDTDIIPVPNQEEYSISRIED